MPTFTPSDDLLTLTAFVDSIPHGMHVTYAEIAEATSICMNERGKQLLRRACAKVNKEYLCKRAIGIQFVDATTTMPCLSEKFQRIDGALGRAQTAYSRTSQFIPELNEEDKRRALFIGGVFGAMQATAHSLKREYLKKAPIPVNTQSRLQLP